MFVAGAAVCFHVAYFTPLGFFIFGYVICLAQLARMGNVRFAFYAGFAAGVLCFAPQLWFFMGIFGGVAVALWGILAFWIALFVALACAAWRRLGPGKFVWLAPFLWMGLEYFRSELYYLRFTWLNVGYAMAGQRDIFIPFFIGVYGTGFLAAFAGACIAARKFKWPALVFAAAVVVLSLLLPGGSFLMPKPRTVKVVGVQMEFPSADEVIANLDKALAQHPEGELFVLSEYTFEAPVPQPVTDWCREKQRYLIIGATDPAPGGDYYDTAFVIGPDGNVVFKQAKSVPIQFFKDGLPAQEQRVWQSPWGRIGICICYDLSYTQVTDALMRQGARAIIVPAMDVERWGAHEHELNARVATVRAAEYDVPVFRIASSGISQLVDANGVEIARTPVGAEGAVISGEMVIRWSIFRMATPGDRYLAWVSVVVTAAFIIGIVIDGLLRFALRTGRREPVMEI